MICFNAFEYLTGSTTGLSTTFPFSSTSYPLSFVKKYWLRN